MIMIRNIQLFILVLILGACSSIVDNPLNNRESFNNGWMFRLQTKADTIDFTSVELDDSQWRKLNLPHDWAIEGDFSRDNPSGTGG